MNSPFPNPAQPQPGQPALAPTALPPAQQDDGDEINLLELLDVILDHRWLIAGVTAAVLAVGAAYAVLSTPIYQADTLIQVEDSKSGGITGLLGDMGSMFDIQSPATAEMEILRSRMVVGQAVDNLQLDLEVRPKYLPLLGRWLSRHATGLSNPGFLGLGGYVSGTEALQVTQFDVPKTLEGLRNTVVLTPRGFRLLSPDGAPLGEGRFGQPLDFRYQGEAGSLLITSAQGKPGAAFYLTHYSSQDVIASLQKNINIAEQGKQSGMIHSTFEGDDPVRIARTLNEISALYVRQNVQRKAAEAEKSLAFLDTQLPQLKQQLEASEQKFNTFRTKNNVFDLNDEAKVMLDQSSKLQINLIDLQQKRKELASRFTDAHPSVQTIDAQIRSINDDLAKLNARAKSFPMVQQDLLRLTRDARVNGELYTSLLNSLQQLRLVKEGRVGNVRVIDQAVVAEKPVKPKRALVLALAGLLGLLAGTALAFLRNSLRPGIKDPAEIEQHTGLSVFATVPHSDIQAQQAKAIKTRALGNRVLALQSPNDPVVESLRSLRTALQFAMLGADSNRVLFTGPTPGIGKSFISVNFATIMGAAGKRVLLIDADLRKGYLNNYFGLDRGGGLSETLSGSLPLDKTLRRAVAPNVDFLSTGILPPNPAELLQSPAMQTLLAQVSEQYELIIIDSPPVLVAADASILAPQVGAVFMLARAEVTSLGELQESAKRLHQAGAQPRGVIFNDLNMSRRRYAYGLGSGKYRYVNYQY